MNLLLKNSLVVATLAICGTAFGVDKSVVQRFDTPQMDHWICLTEEHGYMMHFIDGVAAVTKLPGLEDGLVRLNGTYEINGDFFTTVTAHRSDLNQTGEMGIVSYYPNGEFNDIFFFGNDLINANIYQLSGGSFESVSNSDPTVRLSMRRSGETVTLTFGQGENETVLHQHTSPALTGPVKIGIFLLSEYGTHEPLSGWFDDWAVYAEDVQRQGCAADLDDGTFEGRRDCGVTIDDLIYFLREYGTGSTQADLDDGTLTGTRDGGVTVEDLLFFLDHYYAGC